MSERRSWDVQPNKRPIGAIKRPPQAAAPSREAPRRMTPDALRPVRRAPAPVRAPRRALPPGGGRERLRSKRNRVRKTGLMIGGAVLVVLLALLIYVAWLPQLRVTEVAAEGPSSEVAVDTARAELTGRRALILPRNSIFFLPKDDIREAVLAAHPDISALSIRRTSLRSIALVGTSRAKAFVWCGTSIETGYPEGGCFDADAEGLVYQQASVSTSTVVLTTDTDTPATAGDLRIFSALDRELGEGVSPVGGRVINHEAIPNALRFVKAVRGLRVPVSALALRGDEADLWLGGPTRITYVLGKEEEAAQLANSVVPSLDLTNGSIEYLDLRFSGKAYVKRYGE